MIPGTPWLFCVFKQWIDKVIFAMIHSLCVHSVQSVNSRVSYWQDTAKTASSNYFYCMLTQDCWGKGFSEKPRWTGSPWFVLVLGERWQINLWLLIKNLRLLVFKTGKGRCFNVNDVLFRRKIQGSSWIRELWTSRRKGEKILEKCPKRMHKS